MSEKSAIERWFLREDTPDFDPAGGNDLDDDGDNSGDQLGPDEPGPDEPGDGDSATDTTTDSTDTTDEPESVAPPDAGAGGVSPGPGARDEFQDRITEPEPDEQSEDQSASDRSDDTDAVEPPDPGSGGTSPGPDERESLVTGDATEPSAGDDTAANSADNNSQTEPAEPTSPTPDATAQEDSQTSDTDTQPAADSQAGEDQDRQSEQTNEAIENAATVQRNLFGAANEQVRDELGDDEQVGEAIVDEVDEQTESETTQEDLVLEDGEVQFSDEARQERIDETEQELTEQFIEANEAADSPEDVTVEQEGGRLVARFSQQAREDRREAQIEQAETEAAEQVAAQLEDQTGMEVDRGEDFSVDAETQQTTSPGPDERRAARQPRQQGDQAAAMAALAQRDERLVFDVDIAEETERAAQQAAGNTSPDPSQRRAIQQTQRELGVTEREQSDDQFSGVVEPVPEGVSPVEGSLVEEARDEQDPETGEIIGGSSETERQLEDAAQTFNQRVTDPIANAAAQVAGSNAGAVANTLQDPTGSASRTAGNVADLLGSAAQTAGLSTPGSQSTPAESAARSALASAGPVGAALATVQQAQAATDDVTQESARRAVEEVATADFQEIVGNPTTEDARRARARGAVEGSVGLANVPALAATSYEAGEVVGAAARRSTDGPVAPESQSPAVTGALFAAGPIGAAATGARAASQAASAVDEEGAGEFADDAALAATLLANRGVRFARNNPNRLTGQVAGGAVLSGALIRGARAAGGPRAARATAAAIDPAEEVGRRAASGAARSARVAASTAGDAVERATPDPDVRATLASSLDESTTRARAEARRLLDDDRAQGQLPRGRSDSESTGGDTGDTTPVITADDIQPTVATADPTRGGRFGSPPSGGRSPEVTGGPDNPGGETTSLGFRSARTEQSRGGTAADRDRVPNQDLREQAAVREVLAERGSLVGRAQRLEAGQPASGGGDPLQSALERQSQAQQPELTAQSDAVTGDLPSSAAAASLITGSRAATEAALLQEVLSGTILGGRTQQTSLEATATESVTETESLLEAETAAATDTEVATETDTDTESPTRVGVAGDFGRTPDSRLDDEGFSDGAGAQQGSDGTIGADPVGGGDETAVSWFDEFVAVLAGTDRSPASTSASASETFGGLGFVPVASQDSEEFQEVVSFLSGDGSSVDVAEGGSPETQDDDLSVADAEADLL